MRQLRPLLLPAIVAEKKASASSPSDDMARFPTSCESFHSTTTSSESSCPPTPTFSIRGHSRYPSSNSSLASSPQTHESILDAVNSSGKLPKLTEEPLERDEQDDEFVLLNRHNSIVSPCLCDDDDCPHQPHSVHGSTTWLPYGRPSVDDSFVDDADFPAEYEAARRQSGESSVSGIGIRFESRFSSFSRRLKNRKRTSGLSVKTQSIAPSFVSSRPASTSRSSSLTGSIIRSANAMERAPTTPVKSYFEIPNDSSPESAVEVVQSSLEPEPFDRELMVSTPLLPPTLMRLRDEDTPSQSPLQSPTVADSGCAFPFGISPTGTPRITATQTPPLSTKPSCSSLSASRSAFSIANADIPPLRPLDLDDKWSAKLGHANFTIYPQPYVPDVFDLSTCQQLFTDWEQARRNFMKHQVRTGEHFGVTSKAYKLSEQKWAEIDAQWKRYHEITLTKAGQHGNLTRAPSQIEPAPLVKLPSLTNKFPAKGDEDIVGPMTQVASPTQSPRSKKASFFKFFADLKISSSLLGKSSPGVRPQR